jgi:hypothetical protein
MTIDAWDDFLADAEKDDRLGKHKAIVRSITDDKWEAKNGYPEQPYKKIAFVLGTANNADIDMAYVDPPENPPTKEELATWTKGKKMGVANAVSMRRQLIQFYGKDIHGLREGDIVGVKVEARKSKKDGNKYPRIVAFVPLSEVEPSTKVPDDIPF